MNPQIKNMSNTDLQIEFLKDGTIIIHSNEPKKPNLWNFRKQVGQYSI